MTHHHLYAAGLLGGIVAVCALIYVLWLDGQLKNARAQATELRRQLAKVVDEREHLRLLYLRARYKRGRAQ